MKTIFSVIITLALFTNYCLSQRSKTIDDASQSINKTVPDYQIVSKRSWFGPGGIGDFIDLVTAINSGFASNTSTLFTAGNSSQAVYESLLLPNAQMCLPNSTFVDGATTAKIFYANETAAEQYLCCQISVFNSPGVNAFMQTLQGVFLSAPNTWASFEEDQSLLIANIAELRSVVTQSIVTGACKDDKRIHYYETQIMRAELIGKIMGLIVKVYNYALSRSLVMASCLGQSTSLTTCAQNTPADVVNTGLPNYQFLPFDNFYQNTCGFASLATFENFKDSPISCSAKRKK